MSNNYLKKSFALEIIQTSKLGMEHARLSGDNTSKMMFEKILNKMNQMFPFKQSFSVPEDIANFDFDSVQYQFKKDRGLL